MSEDRTQQVAAILARIENGESERSACEAENMNRATFRAHALKQQAGDHYARALAALAEEQVEKMEQTIQDMRDKTIDAQQARVEIDARKWFASKFLPKKYGDRQVLAGDPDAPLRSLSDEELDAKLAAKLRALGISNG